jgi:Zinc finger, C3HC4 type (RING finger)
MVALQCISQGGKLRVRITSPGYLRDANCQFPKDLRAEGRTYECDESCISLSGSGKKYFYRVKKNGISVTAEGALPIVELPNHIFTDDSPECSICFEEPKALIFVPCGHYSICGGCNKNLVRRVCPICRSPIKSIITPDQVQ